MFLFVVNESVTSLNTTMTVLKYIEVNLPAQAFCFPVLNCVYFPRGTGAFFGPSLILLTWLKGADAGHTNQHPLTKRPTLCSEGFHDCLIKASRKEMTVSVSYPLMITMEALNGLISGYDIKLEQD